MLSHYIAFEPPQGPQPMVRMGCKNVKEKLKLRRLVSMINKFIQHYLINYFKILFSQFHGQRLQTTGVRIFDSNNDSNNNCTFSCTPRTPKDSEVRDVTTL